MPEEPDTPAPAPPREPRRLGRFTWTSIAAAVAVITGVTALVFELFPGIRPDPKTNLGATVSVVAVERGLTQLQYFQRLPGGDAAARKLVRRTCGEKLTCAGLKDTGEQIYVQTDVQGFKHDDVFMRASLYNARTGVRDESQSVIVARQRLDAPSDRAVVPIWMPCPFDDENPYFVRIELFHAGDHALLAVADSKRFPGRCVESE